MVMELHGAKDYFDCDQAKIVTDGEILQDAIQVAEKLNIKLIYLPVNSVMNSTNDTDINFDSIWQKYIIPLQGKTLFRENGEKNIVTKVDWGGN